MTGQWTTRDRPMVLCVGPNKTATKSMTEMFHRSGLVCRTHGGPRRAMNLALVMMRNASAARPLLTDLEKFDVISDINLSRKHIHIDIAAFVPMLMIQYPDSYFIYNDRDVESWLRSRSGHFDGQYLRTFMTCYNLSESETISVWREYHRQHRENVFAAVESVGGKLLHFRLGEEDPQKICDFVKPDYDVSTEHWGMHNVKATRPSLRKRIWANFQATRW